MFLLQARCAGLRATATIVPSVLLSPDGTLKIGAFDKITTDPRDFGCAIEIRALEGITPRMDLREKTGEFPAAPGVYLFKDAAEKIIYVGKAKSLRHRVKSYFLAVRQADAKTGSLVREIADAEYIVVDNEREALALENNLIKQNKPKFNILLRDDKTYPYICFTASAEFPYVFVTRRLEKNGS